MSGSRGHRPRRARRRLPAIAFALTVAAVVGVVGAIEALRIPPRELARYLDRRASGHGPWIVAGVHRVSAFLVEMDRGSRVAGLPTFGAGAARGKVSATAPMSSGGRMIRVVDVAELRDALERALPGDDIALAPGMYRLGDAPYLAVDRPGKDDHPITLRAEVAGLATLELSLVEGFRVAAPNWTFEGLDIRGACAEPRRCEHAFHVTGGARRFVARNNVVTDFNAHFKVNGEDGRFPDEGRIESNTLTNSTVRDTSEPVTPIDMVGVDGWVIRRNLIADFAKAQGDRISFGAYAKGAGTGNRFEDNVVICESRLRRDDDQRVGISLGGGGTERAFCRDRQCVAEQFGGVIASNVIAACSDDGIYLNRAAGTRVTGNTLLDTAGIMARFAETSAEIGSNVVDGLIRSRDDALIRASDNLEADPLSLYAGVHALRNRIRAEQAPSR